MNWVDLVIIIVLIFFVLESLRRSIISELLDLGSFLLAFFVSFSYYNLPARFFEAEFRVPHTLSLVLGFMAGWFISETAFYLLVRIITPKLPKIKILNVGIFSIVPAILRGLIFIALFLVMTATFPIQPSIKTAILNSKIGSEILKSAYSLEQPVKNVFGGVANDSLSFLTIKPKTDERINLGFKASQHTVDSEAEKGMLELVNKERKKLGFKELKLDVTLAKIARLHSQDMLERGYFSHYSPEGESVADRAQKNNIDFLVIGENLAYAPNLEAAHKGLMNSQGHRANILSTDYGKIGIGVLDAGVYGKMFVQVFSN